MKTLRGYQDDFLRFFLRHLLVPDGDIEYLLDSTTGSGKTLIIQVILGYALEMGIIKKGLVITPQVQIEQGFLFKHPLEIKTYKGLLRLLPSKWAAARISDTSVSDFLRATKPKHDVMVTTHSAVTLWAKNPNFFPADLTGHMLVVDESHRAGTNTKLEEKFIAAWRKRGGLVFFATATAFRTDGELAISDDVRRAVRTIAEHADGIHAPSDLKVRAVPLCLKATNLPQYTGDALGQSVGDVAQELRVQWDKDGNPKLVIIVPAKGSRKLAKKLEDEFTAAGARVRNVVGIDVDNMEFATDLEYERNLKDFHDSKIKVIIACKRFDVGTDWPLCSHVYNIGVPGAFNLIIQRWGRTMRSKLDIANYPKAHQNVASITFFVPHMSDAVWDKFEERHKDHVFLLACFLQDVATAQEYRKCLRWRPEDVGRVRSGTKPTVTDGALLDDIQAELMGVSNIENRAFGVRTLIEIEVQMEAHGKANPTLGEVLDYAENNLKLPPERVAEVKDLWGFNLLLSAKGQGSMVRLIKRLRNRQKGSPKPLMPSVIREELRASFSEVIESYQNVVTVPKTPGVTAYYGNLSGQTAQKIAADLKDRLVLPDFNVDALMAGIASHVTKHHPDLASHVATYLP